jgi:hypothetical protein
VANSGSLLDYVQFIQGMKDSPAMRWLQDDIAALKNSSLFALTDVVAREATRTQKLLEEFGRPLTGDVLAATGEYLKSFSVGGAMAELDRYFEEERRRSAQTDRVLLDLQAESASVHLSKVIEATTLAERAFLSTRFDRVGSFAGLEAIGRLTLQSLTDTLSSSFAELIAATHRPDGLFASLPHFVTGTPPENLFLHTSTVRSISEHDEYQVDEERQALARRLGVEQETHEFLMARLPQLKKPLLEVYQGAVRAAERKDPDWPRHAADSYRQLLQSVLHNVAPDVDVTPWAKGNNGEFDDAGHPTRRTKVKWLCQQIPAEHYRRFVQTDLESALGLIGVCDEVVHVDEAPWFPDSFRWASLRMQAAIKHLLQLWLSRNQG